MPRLILGDNPFFAISHLGPEKSREYLQDPDRFKGAAAIINRASDVGSDLMMISSHGDTQDLLKMAGYPGKEKLPGICLVVPNVHDLNVKAASQGLQRAISLPKKLLTIFKSLNIRRTLRRFLVGNMDYPQIKYLALHNVVVDMLIGLRAISVLKLFVYLCKVSGYKAVFLTLNPTKLLSLNLKAYAVCTYYNSLGFNVTVPIEDTLKVFNNQNSIKEIWAMGILASGAVSINDIKDDTYLKQFTRVIIASSRYDRLQTLADAINYDK